MSFQAGMKKAFLGVAAGAVFFGVAGTTGTAIAAPPAPATIGAATSAPAELGGKWDQFKCTWNNLFGKGLTPEQLLQASYSKCRLG